MGLRTRSDSELPAGASAAFEIDLSTESDDPLGPCRSGGRDLIGAWLEAPSLSCPPSRSVRATLLWLETDERMAMSTMTETARRVTAGVDTHRDVHVVAVLDERGAELGCEPFAADPAGYRKALAWVRGFGPVERIGVEGTGSYGAGLTRDLHNQRVVVVEVSCPNRQLRRSHGKSDPVDAVAAARAAQSGEASAKPKTRTGNVEAIRALRVVRTLGRQQPHRRHQPDAGPAGHRTRAPA